MSKKSYRIALAVCATLTARAADAATLPVIDTAAKAQLVAIQKEVAAGNTTLQRIADSTNDIDSTTSDTLDVFTSTTATLVPTIEALDGGGTAEGASDAAEFMPSVNGLTTVSPTSTSLLAAEKAAILADQAQGLISGDPLIQHAERQRRIATNILGEAYNDLLIYAARLGAANSILPKLATANIKEAIVMNGGLLEQLLEQGNLLGQTHSLNTVAIVQLFLSRVKATFQHYTDHSLAAKLFII